MGAVATAVTAIVEVEVPTTGVPVEGGTTVAEGGTTVTLGATAVPVRIAVLVWVDVPAAGVREATPVRVAVAEATAVEVLVAIGVTTVGGVPVTVAQGAPSTTVMVPSM